MNDTSQVLKEIEESLTEGPRNVVELVDDLLPTFQKQAMVLKWNDGKCCFHCLPDGALDSRGVPIPRSVFRSVLARMAVLCNQNVPDSVTPYGGEGELLWRGQHFRMVFANNNQEGCFLEIFPIETSIGRTASKESSLREDD